MKKLIFVIVGLMFLVLAAPLAWSAHVPGCHPIEQAKADVATWNKDAVWEYVKEGAKYDALMAWIKAKPVAMPASIDGILITYLTDPTTGSKRVYWAISPDGKCVEMSTFQNMTRNDFDAIAGKDV